MLLKEKTLKQHNEESIRTLIRLMRMVGNTDILRSEITPTPAGTNSNYAAGKGHGWVQAAEEVRSFFDIDMEVRRETPAIDHNELDQLNLNS